MFLVALVGEAL